MPRPSLELALVVMTAIVFSASPAVARNAATPPGGGGDALPTSTADHNVNHVQTTVTDVGAYGYYDPQAQMNVGLGFRFMGFPNALFHAGLIYGVSPTQVSDAAFGSDDQGVTRPFNFRSTLPLTVGSNQQIDQYTCSSFDDSDFDTNPLGVVTRQSTYAWAGDSYVIVDVEIHATNSVSGLFVGLFTDWDIGTFDQNQVTYDFGRRLGIMNGVGGDPNFYGLQLLSHNASGYRAIDNQVYVYPQGPDPGFEDVDKFQFFQGFGVVNSNRPADWSNMISAGPFNLPPNGSVRVAFAMLAATTPSNLALQADQARARWNAGIQSPCVGVSTCQFPPAGTDGFESTGQVVVEIPDLLGPVAISLSGPVVVRRSAPIDIGGVFRIDTELMSMNLSGLSCIGPVNVHLNPAFPSLGQVLQNQPGDCYPASSFFDVFVKIDVQGQVFHNNQPLHISSTIHSLPPYDDPYQGTGQVTLHDQQEQPVGTIIEEIHTPQPPFDCMFSNARVDLSLFGNPPEPVFLNGPVLIRRDAPLFNPGNNRWEMPTEMVALDLRGVYPPIGPMVIGLNPDRRTLGQIQQPGFEVYPASSYFDVFFRAGAEQNPDICVQNSVPTRVQATIPGVPPINIDYPGDPVPVVDWKTGEPVGDVPVEIHTPTNSFPWHPFPLSGTDYYCATCDMTVRIGNGQPVTVTDMPALWVIDRADPVLHPNGLSSISDAAFELTASGKDSQLGGDVFITTNGDMASPGEIDQLSRGPSYPASSSINLFLRFSFPGMNLHLLRNDQAFQIGTTIQNIPFAEPHQGQGSVALLDSHNNPVATLLSLTVRPTLPFSGGCAQGEGGPVLDCGVQRAVPVPESPSSQARLALRPSVPNPFSSSAEIRFELPVATKVEVSIYDVVGRLVRQLDVGPLTAGLHSVTWDGLDDAAKQARSGLYLYSMRTAAGSVSGRLLLLR